MNGKIEKIKNFRLFLLKQLEGLTTAQWNAIPQGYKNNLIWNLGHLMAAQQNVSYIKAGLPTVVEDHYFLPYLSGTKPTAFVNEQDIQTIKEQVITSMDRMQVDLDQHAFAQYSPSVMIPKVYGFEVDTIDGALDYLLYHEGFHAGYMLALKQLV